MCICYKVNNFNFPSSNIFLFEIKKKTRNIKLIFKKCTQILCESINIQFFANKINNVGFFKLFIV